MTNENKRYFENEVQRKADKRDEIRANTIAIAIPAFILICILISIIQSI